MTLTPGTVPDYVERAAVLARTLDADTIRLLRYLRKREAGGEPSGVHGARHHMGGRETPWRVDRTHALLERMRHDNLLERQRLQRPTGGRGARRYTLTRLAATALDYLDRAGADTAGAECEAGAHAGR